MHGLSAEGAKADVKKMLTLDDPPYQWIGGYRHDICQKFYTTGVFGAKILPKKVRKSRQWQIYDKTA